MRRLRIDFNDLARQSGMRRGRIGFSPLLGWVVLNTSGDPSYPDAACITPPPMAPGESLRIEHGFWVYESEEKK